MTDVTAVKLLNTVRGIDLLELVAQLLHEGCVADEDFISLGLALARSFTKEGFAFGLFHLFDKASVRMREESVKKEACAAVRTAAEEFVTTIHTQEMASNLIVRRSYSFGYEGA